MTIANFLLILTSVVLSAVAQLSFKIGVSSERLQTALERDEWIQIGIGTLLSPNVLVGLALYGLGTVLWLGVLSRVELSQAYPFVGLGFVLTAAMGWLLLGETMSLSRLGGTLLIVGGIFLVARA
jgi:drug/metabolite transporter (DMT)-like permease